MNYFAHARIAACLGRGDAAVLGSMLPDFARMIGVRLLALDHPQLHEGAELHHRTDAAFHATPGFRALEREGVRALQGLGLRRGPARGAAHVGVELLLDAALAGHRDDARYLAALDAAPGLAPAIRWRGDEGPARFARLHARLCAAGAPGRRPSPERVGERIARALDPRPRLRLSRGERDGLVLWLAGALPAVERRAARLVDETLAHLRA